MKINNFLKDISGFFRIQKRRKLAIKKADDKEIKKSNINLLAKKLHPVKIEATVFDILQETKDSKRIALKIFFIYLYLTISVSLIALIL